MAKVTTKTNWRVVVRPGDSIPGDDEEEKARLMFCRLVGDKSFDVGVVVYDTVETCSFCGGLWRVDCEGFPHCCRKAREEWASNTGNRYTKTKKAYALEST